MLEPVSQINKVKTSLLSNSDIELINNTLEEEPAKKVLYKNAMNWYLR